MTKNRAGISNFKFILPSEGIHQEKNLIHTFAYISGAQFKKLDPNQDEQYNISLYWPDKAPSYGSDFDVSACELYAELPVSRRVDIQFHPKTENQDAFLAVNFSTGQSLAAFAEFWELKLHGRASLGSRERPWRVEKEVFNLVLSCFQVINHDCVELVEGVGEDLKNLVLPSLSQDFGKMSGLTDQ